MLHNIKVDNKFIFRFIYSHLLILLCSLFYKQQIYKKRMKILKNEVDVLKKRIIFTLIYMKISAMLERLSSNNILFY